MSTDSIIISGLACRLPYSENASEFWRNLMSHVDMVQVLHERWPHQLFALPERYGQMPNVDKFDADLFGIHPKQAHSMDPQLRILLEVAYEAILDAGWSPWSLAGSDTGVFVGACFSDAHALYSMQPENLSGYENTGCAASMFANRISYTFDLHGPSLSTDTACSSGLVALDSACQAIHSGRCEIAIVAASNAIFHPSVSLGFASLKMLSKDGKCRSFDHQANGYVRADGVVVLVLCKPSLTRRQRAQIIGSGVNSDGHTDQGITFPSSQVQQALLTAVCAKSGISPTQITYVEAHGTGTRAGDPEEAKAIAEVFRPLNKSCHEPLLVGAVKSNMGHAEAASGLVGLTKVLLSLEKGLLPANLHFEKANPDITAIAEGRIEIISENRPWSGGYIAVNAFGFGGTNANVLIDGRVQPGETGQPLSENEIIPLTHRTESGLNALLSRLQKTPPNEQTRALLRGISDVPLNAHPHRGVLVSKVGKLVARQALPRRERPPLYFVFPGMGSQWPAMGAAFGQSKTSVFRRTLERCQRALPKTFDLIGLLVKSDADLSGPIASQVAVVAFELALYEQLAALGLRPDGVMGHSIGELACAYVAGALTIEQAMRVALARGRSLESQLNGDGAMAAVALSDEEARRICPKEITIACYNNSKSVTFSGHIRDIQRFVNNLKGRGVDAKLIPTAGIAFHSPFLKPSIPIFRKALESLFSANNPSLKKPYTTTWISTSRQALQPDCDIDYLVGNLANPVDFQQAMTRIPDGAVVVEVGPSAPLASLVAEDVATAEVITLTRRNESTLAQFYSGVSNLYLAGIDIEWDELFPKLNRPLTDVPTIEGLASFDHTQTWQIPKFPKSGSATDNIRLQLTSERDGYLLDHKLLRRSLMPATGYLLLVWRTLAARHGTVPEQFPITFTDVVLHRATTITKGEVIFEVQLLHESYQFEVRESGELVASGVAQRMQGPLIHLLPTDEPVKQTLDGKGFYKELRLRGYEYGPAFQGIEQISLDGRWAMVKWQKNWVSFLDAVLQMGLLDAERKLFLPVSIERLSIDPTCQPSSGSLALHSDKHLGLTECSSMQLRGLRVAEMKLPKPQNEATFYSQEFVPLDEEDCLKKQSDVLPYRYYEVSEQRALARFDEFIQKAQENRWEIPVHINKLDTLLRPLPRNARLANQYLDYLDHPQAKLLQLLEHCYQTPKALLNNPMPVVLSFPEYGSVYSEDLAASLLLKERYLGSLLEIVREASAVSGVMRICEVGAGTGGLSVNLARSLLHQRDRYVLTDISAGFFPKLKNLLSRYANILDFVTWDVGMAAPAEMRGAFDLVVASNAVHVASNIKQALENIHQVLDDRGFLILHEINRCSPAPLAIWGLLDELWDFDDPEYRSFSGFISDEHWQELLDQAGFDRVAIKNDGSLISLYLYRKRARNPISIRRVVFEAENGLNLDAVQNEIRALQEDKADQRPLWIEGDSNRAPGLLGMVSCTRLELSRELIRALYVEGDISEVTDDLRERLLQSDLIFNVVREGRLGTMCHVQPRPLSEKASINLELAVDTPGDLSSLHWQSAPLAPAEIHDTYHVCYAALNFRDIMLASGKLSFSVFKGSMGSSFGSEFSGYDRSGNRIMGCLPRPVGRQMWAGPGESKFILKVPDAWTLEQAATVPLVYLTAYVALVDRARLRPGQSILIHSGTGGVGQAAIHLALSMELEIFTTVGTTEKRAHLRKLFPQIPESHIGSSRDASFEYMVRHLTHGEGVDAVLNSLTGELLEASLRLVRRHGHFLEIGKYDMAENSRLGMAPFLRDLTFHGIGIDNLLVYTDPERTANAVQLLEQGIRDGVVKPLETTVFEASEIVAAARHMARGIHVGKILLRLRDPDNKKLSPVSAVQRFRCNPSHTYLITGGLGGIGLELANWLIIRGARKLVLTSRTGVRNNYQAYQLEMFRRQGAEVEVSTKNVSKIADCKTLIEKIEAKAPLGGIFHLAMVLDDGFFVNQTAKTWQHVIEPKFQGAINLDLCTRECAALAQFVVFSSLAGARGNPGQSNYGYANVAADELCRRRHAEGLPGAAIQWGPIDDVGFFFNYKEQVDIASVRVKPQSIDSCLRALESCILNEIPVMASVVDIDEFGLTQVAVQERLSEEQLVEDIKSIIGLSADVEIGAGRRLIELGVDSLMVVEIRHRLRETYGLNVGPAEIRDVSLDDLVLMYTLLHTSAMSDGDSLPVELEHPLSQGGAQNNNVIECYRQGVNSDQVLYVLAGFMVDGSELLAQVDLPAKPNVFLVRYDECSSHTELFDALTQHVMQLPNEVVSVKVLCHSMGATMMQHLLSMGWLESIDRDVEIVAVAPVSDGYCESLRALNSEELVQISDSEALTRLRELPFYIESPKLPLANIRRQVMLLGDTRNHQVTTPFNRILLPRDDTLCITVHDAATLGYKIQVVDGFHDLSTVSLGSL
ncbi:MAG: SDR family NAD(P)-dependent oxidoreductase [Candidatus Thiodiazotropha sp.]